MLFHSWFRAQVDFHRFGLAVGVGSEIEHFRARLFLRHIIFAVARNSLNSKAFHIHSAFFSVAVDGVVDGALVVFAEHGHVNNVLAHEFLVLHLGNQIFTIGAEYNYIVDVRAVAYIFVFLQACANKAFLAVAVEFLVRFGHLRHLNVVETADFSLAVAVFAIFLLNLTEVIDCEVDNMLQIVLHLGNVGLQIAQVGIGFVA